jgi:hypothetical protein
MKSYIDMWEEAMGTASAGLGTGTDITDDDMRVPSGSVKMNKRIKAEAAEEDASELPSLSGDAVADKQSKSQPLQAPDGADSSGV